VVRHAGFTVEEMFASFDRSGDGEISASEFCSMLRLIVGNTFDKRMIYQALFVLDTDRSKTVSRDELFMFIYKTWRSQMDEIDAKLQYLDEENDAEAARITELMKERKSIVAAVKSTK
jgi:Ca2+-binding EF-hand superfamily protein